MSVVNGVVATRQGASTGARSGPAAPSDGPSPGRPDGVPPRGGRAARPRSGHRAPPGGVHPAHSNIDTTRPNGLRGERRGRCAGASTCAPTPTALGGGGGGDACGPAVSPTQELRGSGRPRGPGAAKNSSALRSVRAFVLGSTRSSAPRWRGGTDASLLYLLLDDLPGATLVSGYAILRGGGFDGPPPAGPPPRPSLS